MVKLEEMVFNLDRAAIEFGKMDFNTHLDLKAYSDNIKTYESHGDELMHQVISDLNQTFITPIEREDILSLCNAIDDVLDAIEETSAMFEMYSIEYTDEYMAEFVDNIQKAIAEMKLAVGLLVDKNYLTCAFILLILKNLKLTVMVYYVSQLNIFLTVKLILSRLLKSKRFMKV